MTMTKPDFVYTTYIMTTPQKVWDALVDTDITRQYWADPTSDDPGHVNVSDWQIGSKWEHQRLDAAATVDVVGKVVESNPPAHLVLSWARPKDIDDPSTHSTVTFDIEMQGAVVRLTVTHTGLDEKMLNGISGGWPKILSIMKTLLESGRGLPRKH
jgi:uncharacterized protein YndB with AHSA1/START domain